MTGCAKQCSFLKWWLYASLVLEYILQSLRKQDGLQQGAGQMIRYVIDLTKYTSIGGLWKQIKLHAGGNMGWRQTWICTCTLLVGTLAILSRPELGRCKNRRYRYKLLLQLPAKNEKIDLLSRSWTTIYVKTSVPLSWYNDNLLAYDKGIVVAVSQKKFSWMISSNTSHSK